MDSNLFGISELVPSEVLLYAPVEDINVKEVGHHPDEWPAFAVGNVVKDLVDLCRMVDRNWDRMGRDDRIWKQIFRKDVKSVTIFDATIVQFSQR